jgi:hypothetical protein
MFDLVVRLTDQHSYYLVGDYTLGNRSRGGAMIFQIGLDLEHGFRPKYLHEQAEAPYRTAA